MNINMKWYWAVGILVAVAVLSYVAPMVYKKMKAKSDEEVAIEEEIAAGVAERRMAAA